jgi:glycosyltransferase involved in cell wall biosynthesis
MTPSSNPLVSLCVPTWNRGVWLRESLDSIRAQNYDPVEILISDNGSTDDTESVCRQVAAEDSRIRYFRHPRNTGLYQNHNFLLDQSLGEFVCFFHDHDTRSPHIVSEYVRFMQRHPDVGVVCSDWEVTDGSGHVLGFRDHAVPAVCPGLEFIEQTIRSGRSSIGAPGVMLRRSALGGHRIDAEGPLGFGDFALWFRIAEEWSIGHIRQRLWSWRQDANAQSVRRIVSLIDDYDLVLNAYCDGYLTRWPGQTRRVERWRRLIRRYIFWALAFEIGLHHRNQEGTATGASDPRAAAAPTLFEMLPYRLTDQEFKLALARLRAYRTGLDQSAALFVLQTLLRFRCTWPLAWMTRHYASARVILGLR